MQLPFIASTALFLALFLLALSPNLSVLIVTTRSASAGFKQGAWAATGVVAATWLHALFAVFVLLVVTVMRPEAQQVLRLIAAVYLVWNGLVRIRTASLPPRAVLPTTRRDAASFVTGFLLTFLNLKSILFYVCFLPAFVSFGRFDARGMLVLLGVIAAAGLGARLLYAAASAQGRMVPGVLTGRILNVVAGAVVAAAGARLAWGGV